MFNDKPTDKFPNDTETLGKYLMPSIDTGSAHCATIGKSNGNIVNRTTYRALTQYELIDAEHCRRREQFLKEIHAKWGKITKDSDLGPEGLNLVDDDDVHDL